MRRLTTSLLVAAVLSGLFGLLSVAGAPPAAAAAGTATLSGPGDSATFSGTAGARRVNYSCTGADDASCFAYDVTIGSPLTLRGLLSSPDAPVADFDLYLFTPGTDEAVATSGHPDGDEQIDAVLHAGTYTVLVQPYNAEAASAYTLTLTASAVTPEGSLDADPGGALTTGSFSGTNHSNGPAEGCRGNADDACDLYRVTVPYAGARIDVFDGAATGSLGEYVTTVMDAHHRELGANTFIDGDDRLSLNLPGAGTYYLQVEVTTAPPGDPYGLEVSVQKEETADPTGVDPQPGPQPADTGLFTKTVGFATKTGYRGVFSWQAAQPVVGVVHYGLSPTALTQTATAPTPVPDTAGLLVVDGLEIGKIYYWQVEDAETGERSVVKSLASTNAYTDWNGSSYTIDLLVQLDAQSLPPEVPADQAIEDISQGFNIFAERVYDATDGFVHIGQVLVTDTNIDYATNVPTQPTPVCAGNNLADVLVTTAVPFDSHTYGGFSIEDPCVQFYVGRLGQLVDPWRDDFHFGYVSTHELMHYAFSTPDLYPPDAGIVDAGGCKNLAWDGSVMHNTGKWNGARWELTELDRNETLTPCDHTEGGVPQPYSWDQLRLRYLNVPLRPAGPIEHVIDTRARGNEDGGHYRPFLLNREPGASTLIDFVPDDSSAPECPADATSSAFSDPEGDVALIVSGVPGGTGSAAQPQLDILAGAITYEAGTLRAALELAGNPDEVSGSFGNRYRVTLNVGDRTISLYATRAITEFASTQTDIRRFEAYAGSEAFPPATTVPITGEFDATTNTVRFAITNEQLQQVDAAAPDLGTGDAVVGNILAESGYDNYTGTAGGDDAAGACSFSTAGESTPVVPELPKGALPLVALVLMAGSVLVLRRRRPTP